MKAVEFCYWLQGMFELQQPKTLNATQTELIKKHLALAFKHDIDPSYKGTIPYLTPTGEHATNGLTPRQKWARCSPC